MQLIVISVTFLYAKYNFNCIIFVQFEAEFYFAMFTWHSLNIQ